MKIILTTVPLAASNKDSRAEARLLSTNEPVNTASSGIKTKTNFRVVKNCIRIRGEKARNRYRMLRTDHRPHLLPLIFRKSAPIETRRSTQTPRTSSCTAR